MVTLTSQNPAETLALGEAWGREAGAGWLVGLDGDLGAGKTELVRGLALGLGFRGRVHSPTFALLNLYEGGRLPLFHLDFYRLDDTAQIQAAGLDDYLYRADGVAVVEWFERWTGRTASPEPPGRSHEPAPSAVARNEDRPRPRPAATGSESHEQARDEVAALLRPAWRRRGIRLVRLCVLSPTHRRIEYEDVVP